MPLLFIGTGTIFVLTGLKGNPAALWSLVQGDFQGQNNFIYWMLSIFSLGALGYIDSLKSLSRLFVVLVFIVLLLDNKGFFAQLQSFINSSQGKTAAQQSPTALGLGG